MAIRRRAVRRPRLERPTSDSILEAAEQVFNEWGYGETSLRMLMDEADVSTTAFYARFGSKEAVMIALVERLLGDLESAATETLSQARTLEEGFDHGVDALVRALAAHKVAARLALTEAAISSRTITAIRIAYGRLADMITAKLRRLVERGDIEVTDAEALGWALVGALQMQVTRWAVYGEIDDRALAAALRSTARTILPAIVRREKER